MGEYKTGTRTIIAVIFLPLLILICYYGRIPFLLIVLIIGLFSYYEFTTLANKKKSNPNLILGLIFLGILYIGLFSAALVSIREFYSGSPLLYNEGGYIILSMLASIWICDTAAC